MKAIKQSHDILTPISVGGMDELRHIESIARTCYKSEPAPNVDPDYITKNFVRGLINRGHEAMLEHGSISVRCITDRGISHELVRHRIASYAQESTRYCNYAKNKFGEEITCIEPDFDVKNGELYAMWSFACREAENNYLDMIEQGCPPELARSVLPTSLKTEIVITANYREWRNIFKLRCDRHAHPQMRELMTDILSDFHDKLPVLFDDVWEKFLG